MQKIEVGTHGGWRGGLCLCLRRGNPRKVVDYMIVVLMVVGHVIIAHVSVPQVLWLSLGSDTFDGWGHILPVLV